ncbi:FAD-binding oxidoreductase [soil metagenome]
MRLKKRTTNLFRTRTAVDAPGLEVSGLDGVIAIDPVNGTADVQGVCTYEDLVAATLAEGFIPWVIPQLKTITLGGAVTGLGIESTSFRNGLPHESVLEMDILTGSGDIIRASETENADLFAAFPNSYGSLGYATRLKIRLEKVPGFVELRHVRFSDLTALSDAIVTISRDRAWDGLRVDGLDGVAFTPAESYLTLARFIETPTTPVSDYKGQEVFYRSIQAYERDTLTIEDYVWRWDTDWFWCSSAFGAQNPTIRRLWPSAYRRSDVFQKLVGLDTRFGIIAKLDKLKKLPPRERVIQDIEVPVGRLSDFVDWFDATVGMRPVWLCPLKLYEARDGSGARTWPLYPLQPGEIYVNVGFWGTVFMAEGAKDGDVNRAIETKVGEFDGHKSLYSDSYYDRETFDRLYNGEALAHVKTLYDPLNRLTELYDKAVKRV